ncbi:MAG: hypothetical protein IPL88_05355 [Rhizobiales bacterium]|nr:hypothetical protein [Hyphomicrobiales bacterium]
MFRCALVAIAGAAAVLAAAPISPAAVAQEAAPRRVEIVYEEPKEAAHRPIYEAVRAARVLEHFQRAMAPFRLPRTLTAKIAGCEGEVNASYENGAITVCYEYLGYVAEVARSRRRPAWLTEKGAMMGPTLDVFFHEAGHALFEYLRIPVLGREEDAADLISALSLLHLGREDAEQLIGGVAFMYLDEAGVSPRTLNWPRLRLMRAATYADEHSTPLQRKYNLLCLAYGFDARRFAAAVETGVLPKARAEQCELEYQQALYAFDKLLAPHLDRALAVETYGADNPAVKAR